MNSSSNKIITTPLSRIVIFKLVLDFCDLTVFAKLFNLSKHTRKLLKKLYPRECHELENYKRSNLVNDFKHFSRLGLKIFVNFFIEKGANYWNLGMVSAAEGGHKDLVELFIEKGADNWNKGMIFAAEGGHKDLVELFIQKGANNWNDGMYYAVEGGNKDLVDFFIQKGADNWNKGMRYAARRGHKDLVNFFVKKGVDTNLL